MTTMTTTNTNCCAPRQAERSHKTSTYRPRFDIWESGDELVLYGDLPGVLPDDLDVQFEDGELTIRGKVEQRYGGSQALRREYGVGDFQRNFAVSESINVEEISAELKNGVLTLRLPKAETAKPRKIKIQS